MLFSAVEEVAELVAELVPESVHVMEGAYL